MIRNVGVANERAPRKHLPSNAIGNTRRISEDNRALFMSPTEITARDYATGKLTRIGWSDGVIDQIEECDASSTDTAPGPWIAPPLVDVQINGFAGVDFQRDGVDVDGLLKATRGLRATGCTKFLLTLITDEWSRMLDRFKNYRDLRDQNPELKDAIFGWHVEGPFLNDKPGFKGAHEASVMRDPTPEDMIELREALPDDAILLTLAPERDGAMAAIEKAVSLGIRVSVGHADPSTETLRRAVTAGATAFTHLGNGCPQELDRHDNIFWRVFDTPGLISGLICDKIHLSPAAFRTIHRALPPEAIYYTTDAVAPAGAPPGCYSVGRFEVEVGEDQVVRQPGQTNFAGSALTPIEGIRRSAEMLDRPWQKVWDFFSAQPARLMGRDFSLKVGSPADFCVINADPANLIESIGVYQGGTDSQSQDTH
ncbi:MAG: N-acetylglucosamine-6-phosphate deacetylase [Candidatus Binatia bacterium]|jgi:N-acetylglucosamine-6-phosphate deacetylase